MTITLNSIPYPKDTVEVEYFGEDSVYLRINEVEGMTGTLTANARVSADALRNAIDEVAGKRLTLEPADKPYRPQDRDRLLRHIEDVEATLTRRNERWEKDQERIRELEAEVKRAENAKNEAQLLALTTRELLEMAWDRAIVPEDGVIHAGEVFLSKTPHESLASVYGPATTSRSSGTEGAYERRLLDPRPEPTRHPKTQEIPHPLTADDITDEMVERGRVAYWDHVGTVEETVRAVLAAALTESAHPEGAEKRKALIDGHGLADWEVELLTGAA